MKQLAYPKDDSAMIDVSERRIPVPMTSIATDSTTGSIDESKNIGEVKHFRNQKYEEENGFVAMEDDSTTKLREGDIPRPFDKKSVGFLFQNAGIGILFYSFPRMVYPFFTNYLNMDGYQNTAAYTLLLLPWTLKIFFGILSDTIPICGYHRRPYMIIGWLWTTLFLCIMGLYISEPYPYFKYPEDMDKSPSSVSDDRLNKDASDQGFKYILLMMMASSGFVLVDVVTGGMVVELSQKEPESIRGTFQSTMYSCKALFGTLSVIFIGLSMSGPEYGGTFNWSLKFSTIMILFAIIPVALLIPSAWFYIEEEKVDTKDMKPISERLRKIYSIIKQRAVYQYMLYEFGAGMFSTFSAAPVTIVQREWAGVKPFNESVFAVIGSLVFSLTLYIVSKYGLNWNWRYMIIFSTFAIISIDSFVSFCTIFNIIRNQWFWLGGPILEELPTGISFIVGVFVIIEIAEPGYEGVTLALLTTIRNLMYPFSATIYKAIDAYFDAFADDIERDDIDARWQVAYTFMIMYVAKFCSLFWLVLLPSQKKEAQELKKNGGSSAMAGNAAILLFIFVFIWSTAINMMTIIPSTACYQIAGGPGCE